MLIVLSLCALLVCLAALFHPLAALIFVSLGYLIWRLSISLASVSNLLDCILVEPRTEGYEDAETGLVPLISTRNDGQTLGNHSWNSNHHCSSAPSEKALIEPAQEQPHCAPEQSTTIIPDAAVLKYVNSQKLSPQAFARLREETFESVETYWPRRLLHIPTMTSIERTGQDTYNGIQRPKYGILTYTWGRWKRRDGPGPALEVKGTPWEIPSVKEEHFTVEAFRKVVERMGQEVDWAWIDVACIEQRDGDLETKAIKMDEIGRQVGIFKNAHRVFVWLSHLSTEILKQHFENIWLYGPELYTRKGSSFSLEDILRNLERSLSTVLEDPWFSSLWTLQEVILRKDALIFTHEADTVFLSSSPQQETYMAMFVNTCTEIHECLTEFQVQQANMWTEISNLFFQNPELEKLTSKILLDINKAGFSFLVSTNPNVQYGVARYRQTRRPLDRIYGIMQIYGLRVGEAINPERTPTLDELEDEFAAAICGRCPILGQRFVHLQRPQMGKAWRISQHSNVPDQILLYKNPKPRCTIVLNSERHAIFKGRKCSLFPFSMLWAQLIADDLEKQRPKKEYIQNLRAHLELILDAHTLESGIKQCDPNLPDIPAVAIVKLGHNIRHSANVVELCAKYGKDKVNILELGTLDCQYGDYESKNAQKRVPAPERSGMLARQVPVEGGVRYERIGICVWNNLAAFKDAGEGFDERVGWEDCEIILM